MAFFSALQQLALLTACATSSASHSELRGASATEARSLSASREDLWSIWKTSDSACNRCLDTSIHELHLSTPKFGVGCVSDASTHPQIPECETSDEDANQAGGHKGTFITLRDGKKGKRTHAFDELSTIHKDPTKAKRTKIFHQVEYQFYMQLWCLKKLRNRGQIEASHVLDPFVFGSNPWAPEFFGICRVWNASAKTERLYVAMEDIFNGYTKPSQLDIKLGISLEPDSEELYSWFDYQKRKLVDFWSPTRTHGARLGGYKLLDYKSNVLSECCEKGSLEGTLEQSKPLKEIFRKSFTEMHQSEDIEMLSFFGSRLQDMFVWFRDIGRNELRLVSSSLLFTYEGVQNTDQKKYNLKIIDFAHAYSAGSRPDWDDKVVLGLTSTMRRVDKMLQRSRSPPVLQYKEVCSGRNCRTPCVKPVSDNESRSAEGVLEFRCESLARAFNFMYFSWEDGSNQHEIQCLLCNKLESTTSGRRRRWWSGDQLRVYKRPDQ